MWLPAQLLACDFAGSWFVHRKKVTDKFKAEVLSNRNFRKINNANSLWNFLCFYTLLIDNMVNTTRMTLLKE